MKDIYATRIGARLGLSGTAARRATTTMADQVAASASNFAVAVMVARLSGPSGLGGFALAYACWILVNLIHRSLITDPMTILGDMRREERSEFIRRGFAAEVTLALTATMVFAAGGTVCFAAGQHTFGVGLLAVAPWIAFLDLQDYWRWIGFMQGLPKKSLQNDLLFIAVQVLAFTGAFLGGLHTVFAAVSAWGLGALFAALYGLRQFSVLPSLRGGVAFLRSRLPTSRWLAGERSASWGASHLYMLLAGVLLGPAALGGLKAAHALVVGPSYVVINAGGSFGLPEASQQFAERGWTGMARVARFVTAAGVLATAACGLVVILAGRTLLGWLYGPQFVVYETSAQIFAVAFFIAAFGLGPVLILTATLRTRPLFIVQLGRLLVSIGAVSVLSSLYGVNGAAMASLLGASFTVVSLLTVTSAARRSVERRRSDLSPASFRPNEEQAVA